MWKQVGCSVGLITESGYVGVVWLQEDKYPSTGKWTLQERWALAERITELLNEYGENVGAGTADEKAKAGAASKSKRSVNERAGATTTRKRVDR